MPELPEVQTVVNDLINSDLIGATIGLVAVHWDNLIGDMPLASFKKQLKGRTVTAVSRRAKYIRIDLDSGQSLVIHLRMTGKFSWSTPDKKRDKHEHIIFNFVDGRQLRYHDTRKFGRLILVDDAAAFLAHLGPEPLEKSFTWQLLRECLQGRRPLKTLLLDQTVVAGLGNIYVDEALWEAKLSPLRRSDSLTAAEIKRLHSAIPRVLKRGLKNMGTSLGTGAGNFYSVAGRRGRNSDGLRVFRRTGLACPRCEQSLIERTVIAQRSTHFCANCQK